MSEETIPEASETEPNTQDTPPADKTFTQSEVNALVAQERRRTTEKFSDYTELKKAVESHEDSLAQARADGEKTATTALVGRLVDTEIRATAQRLGFADPSDSVVFFGNTSEISYDPETGVDRDAITTRLTELSESKPYLLAKSEAAAVTPPSRPRPKPGTDNSGGDILSADERVAAAMRNLSK